MTNNTTAIENALIALLKAEQDMTQYELGIEKKQQAQQLINNRRAALAELQSAIGSEFDIKRVIGQSDE